MGKNIFRRVWDYFSFDETNHKEEFYTEPEDQTEKDNKAPKKNNVISLPTTKRLEVVVTEPTSFIEAQDVADNLKGRKPIIINLQNIDKDLAKRIVDFISGVTYALDGQVQKVGENIFLFTPNNVDIINPDKKEIKDKSKSYFVSSYEDNGTLIGQREKVALKR